MSQPDVHPTAHPTARTTARTTGPTGDPTAGPTGHPAVDEVMASLDQLEGRPVGEHVAVFEAAHERLRGALADAGS